MNLPRISKPLIALLSCLFLLSACATHPPLQQAKYVDPDRFAGEWFVIANIPYFGERNKVESRTSYIKQGPNDYADIFAAKTGSFDAPLEETVGRARSLNDSNTEWLAVFYWVFRFKFNVVHMDEDYQLMLLGHRSRDYGWVMARNNTISDADYQRAMQLFEANGYDTSRFSKVPQRPEDLGKPGYQVVGN